MTSDITAEILIIGTGVAGAIAGAKLAQKGLSVAFLETGKRIDRFEAVETFWKAEIKVPESPYPNDKTAPHSVSHRTRRPRSSTPICAASSTAISPCSGPVPSRPRPRPTPA